MFLAVLSGFCALVAVALVGSAYVSKPELLRSEQHVLRMTMASIIGDRDMPPDTRERMSRAVLESVGPLKLKSSGRDASNQAHEDDGHNA